MTYEDRLKQAIDSCRYWLEIPVEHTCAADYPIGSCQACDLEEIKAALEEALLRENNPERKPRRCPE